VKIVVALVDDAPTATIPKKKAVRGVSSNSPPIISEAGPKADRDLAVLLFGGSPDPGPEKESALLHFARRIRQDT